MLISRKFTLPAFSLLAVLAFGCGSSPDAGKQASAARGSNGPNDPQSGDVRERPDDDPNQEESSPPNQPPTDQPPTCTAGAVASIDGWTTHTNGHFTFQAPSSWAVIAETPGSFTEVEKKLAVGAGYHAYVRETAVAGTPDDGGGRIGDYPSDVATSMECIVQSGKIPGTYACDPMANAQLICRGGRVGLMNVWWRFVYHGGHTFEVWCNESNVGTPDDSCAKLLDTLEIDM